MKILSIEIAAPGSMVGWCDFSVRVDEVSSVIEHGDLAGLNGDFDKRYPKLTTKQGVQVHPNASYDEVMKVWHEGLECAP